MPIRAAIEATAAALSAKDSRAVMSHRAPGYVAYSLAPPLVAENGARDLDAWVATWRGPIAWKLDAVDIAANGDVAFAHGLVHMTGTKTDGEQVDLWFRQTLCLREIEGAWKIAHEHHSVPFYMDGSFRAAVDLKP
jgi:PhnB protein